MTPAGDHGQFLGTVRWRGTKFLGNRSLICAARKVHGGKDEVIRRLVAELDDVFAEVRFHDVEARLFQRVVKVNFLAWSCTLDLMTERALLSRAICKIIRAPVAALLAQWTAAAASFEIFCEFRQVRIEMVDGVPFDFGGRLPGGRPVLEEAFLSSRMTSYSSRAFRIRARWPRSLVCPWRPLESGAAWRSCLQRL